MKKKKRVIIIAVVVIVLLLAALGSSTGGDKDDTAGEPVQTEEAVKQEPETTQEPESKPDKPEESEPASDQETAAEQTEAETDNPLMKAELQVSDVASGSGEKIGEWAEVTIQKDVLKAVTQEQYAEFCESVVKDSGYNWVTISCGDGTGIQFAGSISFVATYGNLDNEGCITETIGTIMVEEDGTYSYTPAE